MEKPSQTVIQDDPLISHAVKFFNCMHATDVPSESYARLNRNLVGGISELNRYIPMYQMAAIMAVLDFLQICLFTNIASSRITLKLEQHWNSRNC